MLEFIGHLLQILTSKTKIMNQEVKRPESLVAAVAPNEMKASPVVGTGEIDFKLTAEEYQGKLRLTSAATMVPYNMYIEVYQNGFPSNPDTDYVTGKPIKQHIEVLDTDLVWGTGYSCAIILKTNDSTYTYEYVCQLTT
ncbi:hypothetical protein GCM10011344_44530 [Dokdonia pacifica]|uniref:Uncharacterized protein n=2 Tax=Dokdonia pacifica TaxID=1627892 RepID=A0A239CM44_9FLAO|nr:hypothetical protein GCM10011344_44530 [Dokdonia pacifica]SNS21207.1 hypothetical protein SAMN06265376_10883 [Dokdonia pacifica]